MDKMESGIKKIAIVGAESTGKTQLCESLALHYNTLWVPEYAREYFNNSDIYNYTLNDLEQIAQQQIKAERDLIQKVNKFLFCDTALITLKIWAELEFGNCPASILKLLAENKYDYYLITNNDVAWEKDEQRLNKFSRELILDLNLKEVKTEETPFGIVAGTSKIRLENAIHLVSRFTTYLIG